MSAHDAKLAEVTARVFEELCFHLADLESEPASCERVEASVAFRGPWNGHLMIGVEPQLLAELASNLVGDDESTPEDREHALLELANVTCGNALPEIESVTAAFELDSPRPGPLASLASRPVVAAATIDGGRISVRIVREELP